MATTDRSVIHNGDTVTISKAYFESLLRDEDTLCKLENAGVDNWEGYSVALYSDLDDEEDW